MAGLKPPMSPTEAKGFLTDGVWNWKDGVAVLSLLIALYAALVANGLLPSADDEPAPAPVVEPEGATE